MDKLDIVAGAVRSALAIHGFMEKGELAALGELALGRHAVAEIGCWKGLSTKVLSACVDGTVYAVDHWQGTPGERGSFHKEAVKLGPKGLLEVFRRNLSSEITAGRVVPVMAESGAAVDIVRAALEGRPLDMVFIDADHTYEAVKRDIQLWSPLIAPGGLISGHDYGEEWPGVKRAVDELLPKVKVAHRRVWYAAL